MLARFAFLLVALPVLAVAATVDGPRVSRLKFAAPAAKPAPAQRADALPDLAAPAPALSTDPSECRMGCARTYYFCRAGEHPDDCASGWGQCVATCNSPALAAGVSTAP